MKPSRPAPTRATLLLLALAAGCGGGDSGSSSQDMAPAGRTVVQDVGLSTPESVLHDAASDVYLVSNINGSPLDVDGNGFISRLSPDGEVLALKWIDGEAEGVTLNAPKGMAILGDTLFVADIDCLRKFVRESGEPAGQVCLDSATFLNDVAPAMDGSSVFFTDTGMESGPDGMAPSGTDAVYRYLAGEGRVVVVKREPSLGGPNGVAVGSRGIMVVSNRSGEVYRLTAAGERTNVMPESDGQYDGIEMMPDGGFIFSSWGQEAVIRVGGAGTVTRPVENVPSPADIGYDAGRNRVLIPVFTQNQVWIQELG
jgi:hypothetical protein